MQPSVSTLVKVFGFLFTLSTPAVAAIIVVVVAGSIAAGVLLGRWLRHGAPHLHGSIDVVQGALFGLIGLLLAFALSLSLDRYEDRRAASVAEADAIGTVMDTAALLPEPSRSISIELADRYAEAAIGFSTSVPGSSRFDEMDAEMMSIYGELWTIAGDVATADPTFTIPMMHLQALSDASSAHTERIESLENRVPDEVMWLLLLVVVLSLGALAMHLTVVGRGVVSSVAAAVVVVLILLTLVDLDRPHRGFITVPDSALVTLVP